MLQTRWAQRGGGAVDEWTDDAPPGVTLAREMFGWPCPEDGTRGDHPGKGVFPRGRPFEASCDEEEEMEEPVCDAAPILFVGTEADELIQGDCANDELYGARGDDTLLGDDGADHLSGNWGDDHLIGGGGADVFSFDGDFDRDTVSDFSIDEGDRLDFVFYGPQNRDRTAEELLSYFVQQGADAVMALPGSDEVVILKNVDVADLSVGMFSISILDDGLVA